MSYKDSKIKRTHDGKTLVPLSVAAEILELRPAIEKNVQHAGTNLEIVYQAFCEIQKAHGHHPPKLDPSCSGCTTGYNDLLKNWFKIYDQGTVIGKAAAGAIKVTPLRPVTDPANLEKKAVKESKKVDTEAKESESTNDFESKKYNELMQMFKDQSSDEEKAAMNKKTKGKTPKKKDLVEYFTNKA